MPAVKMTQLSANVKNELKEATKARQDRMDFGPPPRRLRSRRIETLTVPGSILVGELRKVESIFKGGSPSFVLTIGDTTSQHNSQKDAHKAFPKRHKEVLAQAEFLAQEAKRKTAAAA